MVVHLTPLLKIPVWWRRAVLPFLPWIDRFLSFFTPGLLLGRALLVVVRILRSATGAASEWRPPLAWCVEASPETLVTTGGRLQLPERGRLDPGTLGISCAHRAGPQPLGQLLWEPPQGRRMRRRWTTPAAQEPALSSPPRARAAAGVPHRAALRQPRSPRVSVTGLPSSCTR